jgi:molybdate transport system ATP-binding protein
VKLSIKEVEVRMGEFSLLVDCEVDSSRIGIFGPSGAGKTTLLEVLCGLRKCVRGTICIGGQITLDDRKQIELPPHERSLGYVPQDLALFPHLNVEQNLLYGAKLEGGPFTFEAVSSLFQIGHLMKRGIRELSGGEKQRVALARALLAQPRVLLLDEPFASLDRDLKKRILECVREAQREFALPTICVTHDREEARDLCDVVLLMDRGRITGQVTPAEL